MSWILFSILSAFSYALLVVIEKYLITKLTNKPVLLLIFMSFLGFAASIVIYFLNGFSKISLFYILLALLNGGIYILASWLFFEGLKLEEVSRIVPLLFFSPLFTALFSFVFLGEFFTPLQYFGVLLLVIGAVMVSIKNFKISMGKYFWLIIAVAVLVSVNYTITKYLLNFADFWTVFSYGRIGEFIVLMPFFYFHFNDFKQLLKSFNPRNFVIMFFHEALNLVSILLVIIATSGGYATFVNALTSIEPFFVLLFTIILSIFYPKIIKEDISKSTIFLKITAITLMFIGAFIITS